MKKRDRDRRDPEDRDDQEPLPRAPAAPFNNPFAAALKAQAEAAKTTTSSSTASASAPAAPAQTKRVPAPARAVVRMERKGHGGKEVTVIEQLGLEERDLERWLKSLKQSLGCGGRLDGANIVLQGDHRNTLKKLLEDRGVKKVTLSGV